MKKYYLFVIILFIIICCSGCNGDVTRALRHDNFQYGTEFSCEELLDESVKVKFLTASHIITEKGKIYEVSLSQKFSNDTNCKKANTSIVVDSIFDGAVVKGTDGKIYYLALSNNTTQYAEVDKSDKSINLYNLLLSGSDVIKVKTIDSSNGIYYVLKSDGNIYNYIVSHNNNDKYNVSSVSTIYNKNDFGGNIVNFNYEGNSSTTYIRTNDKLYRMYVDNSDECSKYVDIECKYSMKGSDSFSKYKDYYFAYNGNTLVTTYGRVFNASSK